MLTAIGMGHVRLAIVDRTAAASQPLHDRDHDIHVVFVGEIYNHRELRESLQNKYRFTSQSDSAVLIPLYLEYGQSFLRYLEGDFALCLYDGRQHHLLAARDRYGMKPLFWCIVDGQLLLSSEIQGFLPFGWKPVWDVRSIFEDGWLRDGRTFFEGVQKVKCYHGFISLSVFQN